MGGNAYPSRVGRGNGGGVGVRWGRGGGRQASGNGTTAVLMKGRRHSGCAGAGLTVVDEDTQSLGEGGPERDTRRARVAVGESRAGGLGTQVKCSAHLEGVGSRAGVASAGLRPVYGPVYC